MGLYHEELLNAGFRNNPKHLWESLLQKILGAQNQLAISVPPSQQKKSASWIELISVILRLLITMCPSQVF